MHRSNLHVPGLETEAHALDLGNALMSISGIAHIEVNGSARTVAVDHDLAFLSERTLLVFLKGAGYPTQRAEIAP